MALLNNIFAEWRLNNDLLDYGPSGWNLSQSGTVPFITSPQPPSQSYAAGSFGSGNFLYSDDINLITGIKALSSYRIDFDMYALRTGLIQYIWNFGDTMTSINGVILLDNTVGFCTAPVTVVSTGVIQTGIWHHITCTSDETTLQQKIYIDYKEKGSNSGLFTGRFTGNVSGFQIGRANKVDPSHRFFSGYVSNFVIRDYFVANSNSLTGVFAVHVPSSGYSFSVTDGLEEIPFRNSDITYSNALNRYTVSMGNNPQSLIDLARKVFIKNKNWVAGIVSITGILNQDYFNFS